MICLTMTGKTIKEDLDQFWKNRPYINAAELRMDYLKASELSDVKLFPSQVDLPVILTFRRTSEGGKCTLSEKQRIEYLEQALEGGFAYLDIEDDVRRKAFLDSVRAKGVQIIRSHHDFTGIPVDIFSLITKLAKDGDIPKLAVMPQKTEDLMTLFSVQTQLANIPRKIIVGMGDFGVPTRVLYKKLGSILTYCSDEEAAPGMLSPRDLCELYHADRVNAQTRIYGVVGNPVMQTVSPMIHNPGFHAIHFNAIYVPFQAESIRAFFRLAEQLKINGFSVTIPFKRDVIPFLGRTSREVIRIGSCNTVIREPGLWKGYNTDYYGFLTPLEKDLIDKKIKTAIVVGAGGAARAVVWALKTYSCQVTILNRSPERAKVLAAETMSAYDSLDNAGKYTGKADLIVQATPVGMAPDDGKDPAPKLGFTGSERVCELIYKPGMTKFLSRASKAGCRLMFGKDMLLEQGKLQFEFFTGYHLPPSCSITF